MSRSILIAGSGKIARDTGMYFLKKGHAVSWVSANETRLMELQAWADKSVRIFMKYSGGSVKQVSASFYLYNELEDEKYEVIIECVKEQLEDKKAAVLRLEKYLNNTLLLSVSSSILPSRIHPDCAGFHVFYPLELTKTAEIILPASLPLSKKDSLTTMCAENGITGIVQDEITAFAVNRLLLPLQNEVFRALENGIGADDINGASASPLFPAGQLDFIKKVGPAVVRASVDNYQARMKPVGRDAYMPLSKGLAKMVDSPERSQQGKRLSHEDFDTLKKRLYYLFINTCFGFLERKEILRSDLDHVLDSVFGAEIGLDEAVGKEGKKNIVGVLEEGYKKNKYDFYKPAESLAV